jgi:hypothetical protein
VRHVSIIDLPLGIARYRFVFKVSIFHRYRANPKGVWIPSCGGNEFAVGHADKLQFVSYLADSYNSSFWKLL